MTWIWREESLGQNKGNGETNENDSDSKERRKKMRIGQGYDVHRLVEGRKLILVHAVMDALLGAGALGDIGKHFPDTDPAYEGISSIELLEKVGELLEENGYVIENIDATIIAQRPKLASYRPQMAENIAKALHIEVSQVSVKATTEEGLGFTGTGEGISSQAIALLAKGRELAVDDREQGRACSCPGCQG